MEKTTEFRVGVITSPHGIKGTVKVFPTTEDPERFLALSGKNVLLKCPEIMGKKAEPEEKKITEVGFLKNMVLVHFEGLDTIEQVEKYRNFEIYIPRELALPLEPGEYYVADLIGLTVVDDTGRQVGTLTDVLQTAANDVFVVTKKDRSELLLPRIPDCVKGIDLEKGECLVHILKGLED